MRSFREDGTGLVVTDIGSCNLPQDFAGTTEDALRFDRKFARQGLASVPCAA